MLDRRPGKHEDRRSVLFYDRAAARFADIYESTTFDQVHAGILGILPTTLADVLDVGAGSGRDAAALAQRGHRVTAVEPSVGLLNEAMRRHAGESIRWIKDSLPALSELGHQQFDFILVSAVWMHLAIRERSTAMRRLAALLRSGGCLVITLRHGPIDEERAITSVSSEETIAEGKHFSLVLERVFEEPDVLGRPDISWSTVAFKKPHDVG